MWGLGEELASPDQETREPDAVLVRRAQISPASFEALYLRYRDRILGYCYRRLGDRDDAEDAASAVFVAALRGLGQFHDRGDSFGGWLFRIAHNEVAARHRLRARHPEEQLIRAYGAADPSRSPEEHAVLADGQQRLAGFLCELPQREREVIELRLADLSTAEIGRVLGMSEQNVRTAQARAVARLRRVMGRTDVPEVRSTHA